MLVSPMFGHGEWHATMQLVCSSQATLVSLNEPIAWSLESEDATFVPRRTQ
jgi:hypothetical protein